MRTYTREVRIDAPFDDVWDFHATERGLEALTADWLNLRVERVIGPDGTDDPAVLEPGSELAVSMQPLGIGPRQYWTSAIVARERTDGSGHFRDEMVHGPFDHWVHTHAFFADGETTIVRDHIEYELPLGSLGQLGEPFSPIGFELMFRDRHRHTKQALERSGDEPRAF